tara:strand:- start:1378 stop:1617 length:240 start_codon:yes stop_codon:yes gene_type:complete
VSSGSRDAVEGGSSGSVINGGGNLLAGGGMGVAVGGGAAGGGIMQRNTSKMKFHRLFDAVTKIVDDWDDRLTVNSNNDD